MTLPRVAILGCRGIPARYGGFETFAEELGAGLAARGFAVTVYCLAERGHVLPARHRGVTLVPVAVPRLGPLTALLYDLRSLRAARDGHEVVFMLGYGAGAFLGWGRRPGNQVWVSMDGLEWRRAKWGRVARAWLRRMERAALAAADRVVFDSHAVRRAVRGADAAQASDLVIEYGARLDTRPDPEVLASRGLQAGRYLLLVARIEPENHVREILAAHARAGRAEPLVVVGDHARAGAYGAACRQAAGPSARLLGPLYDAGALAALRHGCRAALHGHSVGGTNPALLEAMAAGCAVVAHDNPFNREVLGAEGLYFADEDALVAALATVGGWDEAERARRGAASRARVAERYTWERIVDAYARALGAAAPAVDPAADEPPAALPVPLPAPARDPRP